MHLRSQRPSLRDPTLLWPTAPPHRMRLRKWRPRPYRELVGALTWLALGAHPDIPFAPSSLARLEHNPGRVHWEAAKRVLRYLKGTKKRCFKLGGKYPEITAFTDADLGTITMIDAQSEHILSRSAMERLAGNTRRSPMSHSHRSSTEVEYLALCDGRFPEESWCLAARAKWKSTLILSEVLLSLKTRFSITVQSISTYNVISRAISSRNGGPTSSISQPRI